ncbi:hypothetical protein ACQKWADRAFT_298434 [Trichoderma austrokoningii]
MSAEDVHFYGHDGQNLDRLVALAKFKFLVGEDYAVAVGGDATRQSGYLASFIRGDWAVAVTTTIPATLSNFDGFVSACKEHFGITDETVQIMRRGELESPGFGT